MEAKPRNYLTIFLVENSDNSDVTKEWRLGVRYHNNNWCSWRICHPRRVSCRPLRLELYFTNNYEFTPKKTRLYPSCYFINIPNKYKIIGPGEAYDHVIDITPWRDFITAWSPSSDRERVDGIFTLTITYPHVHHYSVGYLKWRGWY